MDRKAVLNFIKLHQYNDRQLLVNGALIKDLESFYGELGQLLEWLKKKNPDAPFASVEVKMKRSGFEVGWGDTVGRMIENIQTLLDLLNGTHRSVAGTIYI